MKKKGIDFSISNIEENLSDIAGIRVICSFVDDIYMLADCLKHQDDIIMLQEKDYIAKPKASGYRSLHLILEVPIFLTQEKQFMKVEVQFRTIAMDFWASLEHKMKYKKDIEDAEDDFKLARENIRDMLEQSKDIMEEYTELVKGTDAPRAFEVFSKMALSHAELAKNLMDLHEQKQKLKQTSSTNPPESSTTNIGNQQNIMVSPAELVKMLKNESNNTKTL